MKKELLRGELRKGQRIRFQTVGRGYGYRMITKEHEGTFERLGERSIWVTLDGKETPSLFINVFGIREA